MFFKRLRSKRYDDKCDKLLKIIIHDEVVFHMYYLRIKDSQMSNEGRMNQVYQDIAHYIRQDFNGCPKRMSMRVSFALVDLIRLSAGNFESLECAYIR